MMKNSEIKDDGAEMARIRTVMDTGTLPSSRELNVHFLPGHADRLRPLALQLEAAIRGMQNLPSPSSRYLDPIAARILGKRERDAALHGITDIRYRIQMEAYDILRTEYSITLARPARLPDYREEATRPESLRKWKRHL